MLETMPMFLPTTKLEKEEEQGAVAVNFKALSMPKQPVAINNPGTPRDEA